MSFTAPRSVVLGPALPLILAAACWGTGTVLSRQAVAAVPPPLLLPLQLATSLVFLVAAMRLRSEPVMVARIDNFRPGTAAQPSVDGMWT